MKKALLTILLALTVFVSVFCCPVQAQTHPWNVCATVVYGGKSYNYNMKNHLENCPPQVAFLGEKSRWELYKYLQTLPLTEQQIYNYILPNFDDVVRFFAPMCPTKRDATVTFGGDGFHFCKGNDGVEINQRKLFESLLACHNGQTICLPVVVHKAITLSHLQQTTQLRSTFTTEFANSTAQRAHNIALATQAINGTTVDVGEQFSFNQVVGKRTEQRGYQNAKVIVDGAYVDGIGGGVCQVSTTLYNALLLAGIVPNAHQHTLLSHYVLEGFDAMVSDSGADLTFVNNTDYPLYIQGFVRNKSVTFNIFGITNKYTIVRESVVEVTPFETVEIVDNVKYPHLVYADQTQIVSNGSNGVKAQSMLKYYLDGKLVDTKLLRKSVYKRVNRVIARGALPRPNPDAILPTPLPS